MSYPNPPCSYAEFDAVMNEIDEQLRKENIPIHSRWLHAGRKYSCRYGIKLYFPVDKGTSGNYSDEYVDGHIEEWYNRRYGDRQNIDMSLGSTALIIRDDIWNMRLPQIFGQIPFVVDRDIEKYNYANRSFFTTGPIPTVNILPLINGLSKELAAQLTDDECRNILDIFKKMWFCFKAVSEIDNSPYFYEIQTDIYTAITLMFTTQPHFGQSKWASCQATEKFIKSFLKLRDVSFPKSHNLQSLSDIASKEGIQLDTVAVSRASTSAGVRYGEIQVTADEAVQAHYSSLIIGKQISCAIKNKK